MFGLENYDILYYVNRLYVFLCAIVGWGGLLHYHFFISKKIIPSYPPEVRKRFHSLKFFFKPDFTLFNKQDTWHIKLFLLEGRIIALATLLLPVIRFFILKKI
jgi:hypothetical protein